MWRRADEYLPQKRAMRFVDFISDGDGGVAAHATIRPDNPLMTERGLPAHVGIEFMAQAIAGKRNLGAIHPANSGVILNIKDVCIRRPYFSVDEEINITVETVLNDGRYEVCACVVSQRDVVISAEISVMENGSGR